MKPFISLFFLLCTLSYLLISCNHEEEAYNVVGLWTLNYQEVGTNKDNVFSILYTELRETIGDIYVQADASGSLRIVALKSNWMENADSVSIKDGTYTTDGRTITITIDGISETYTIEDSQSVSIRKQYKTHSNAYIRYYFDEIRYDYNMYEELSQYVSIPSERIINSGKDLSGCYQHAGKEEYYWFLPNGQLRFTFAHYDDSHKNRTLSEEYGTYSLSEDKRTLTINISGICTDYLITFFEHGIYMRDVNYIFIIFSVKDDSKLYNYEYFK